MQNKMPTLLDIAIHNGSDAVAGLIDETSRHVPEVRLGFARTIKGIFYKTLVRTALPTVGFRDANQGTQRSKSRYENRIYQTYIFHPRWECDKAVANMHEDGREAFIAMEAGGIMEASFQHLGQQFYYGRGNDVKGFAGLQAAYNVDEMEVDAEGTDDGEASSVWAIKWGPKDVAWLWGQGGSLALDPVREESIYDDEGNPFTAYIQELLAHPGLQVGSKFSIGRIKNLTEQDGATLNDDMLAELLQKFPVGKAPDVFLMSRRSLEQLRKSRTSQATGTDPAGRPVPTPTEAHGVPIMATDSILNTEAVE